MTFAYASGRIGAMSPRMTAAVLAAGAYLTIVLVPFTKYPANPPTICNPDTIGRRTGRHGREHQIYAEEDIERWDRPVGHRLRDRELFGRRRGRLDGS